MFTLQNLLHLLEKENRGWKNPTTMTKTILMALTDYNYPSDVASKVFSGINQGRNIFFDIKQLIDDEDFETYLASTEFRLRNQNFRNGNFDSMKMVEATHNLLKESTNLNQDIYQGLFHSYCQNKDNRPYLFLSECFYYALACCHDKTVSYKIASISEVKKPQTLPAWDGDLDDILPEESLPPKFWATVEQMTAKEIAVFKTLASLAIIDEDEKYYLYAPVTDEEIQLYKDFSIGNAEFLLMEEFGLINIGARIDNPVSVEVDPAGFQNDNLVLMFTNRSDPFEITYKSYAFTTVGSKLLEILSIGTDNNFFLQLAKLFVKQHKNLPIEFYLVPVEVMDEAESMEELEEFRLQ
ncbi:TPA: hypothetical protein TVR14_000433 [Streptococcus equi subsp. zooepidemicus]|uniref:hypothetical protein n=1 Tax=Streptococcus equi TaxID=1336 RepID=UPI0005BD09D6|nr:hypothetical protein [Streptococcus equi]HEL0726948.1 hypothetical protein [Streptococcus equi subsp. zooepidemicus]KIS11562.1 hypothetical protein AT51_00475 [Streptococcus equi subsp. zooepidemicus Sz57]HEL1077939.1 hypothetical protein [Streptococcus equi subsp. zooepidemicus]HEL1208964.1 hypothetical protein [Streptococcus equi subsp. zooepidemicus]HEL1266545.1 hypothetical protein [Streptococcus equi subsp. zooepidemicus]